jgi:nucleotide-binding universal stress UspA family protein
METVEIFLIALAWVLSGVATAFVMRRRGHDLAVWLGLGSVLGPFIIPLAIERARFHEAASAGSRVIETPIRRGFDVVAGIDRSDEAIAAVDAAVELFGHSITTLTLVTVLDYDAQSAAAGFEPREKAQEVLDELAARVDVGFVRTQILFGRADRELAEYASTHGAELIVVGARGHGTSEALFGSITSRLVGACGVPVFVGPSSIESEDASQAHVPIGAGA